MDARNLHQALARANGVNFENASVRFGQDGRNSGRRFSNEGLTTHYHAVSHTKSGPVFVPTTQDVRDDVPLPPAIRSITMMRGLTEVTNRLDHRFDNDHSRLSTTDRYNKYLIKQLPDSVYTERFRSLATASGYEQLYIATRPDVYGSSSSRVREELARRRDMSSQNVISKLNYLAHKQHSQLSGMVQPLNSPSVNNDQSPRKSWTNTRYGGRRGDSVIVQDFLRNDYGQVAVTDNNAARNLDDKDEQRNLLNNGVWLKRPHGMVEADSSVNPSDTITKKSRLGMLDILCSATLELGPIQTNPTSGCSCPRSNCIKLYCDCFKAGRPCSGYCSCLNCKNTKEETTVDGERIRAIKNTLARNPRAFTGGRKEAVPQNPGDIVCNCLKSRCLKLYCQCFNKGRTCNGACLCISCLNTPTENVVGGRRNLAIQNCLEKRPDAFTKKPKAVGAGCACKNNKCLKKYW